MISDNFNLTFKYIAGLSCLLALWLETSCAWQPGLCLFIVMYAAGLRLSWHMISGKISWTVIRSSTLRSYTACLRGMKFA